MPRKKPFSGKQKKKQLQDKRLKKQDGPRYLAGFDGEEDDDEGDNNTSLPSPSENADNSGNTHVQEISGDLSMTDLKVQKIHEQPERNTKPQLLSINNFRLHFFKETEKTIEKGRKNAQKPIKLVDDKHLELSAADVYPSAVLLDFPKRPSWSYSLSKEKLDSQEHQYFKSYINQIIRQERFQELSYFELNLETWRQLWRVLEVSDVLLIISDARYPVLHVPPSLIRYIVQDLHKHVIIILNKIDFIPLVFVSLWKSYLESQFPGTCVVLFSSFLKELHDGSNVFPSDSAFQGLRKKHRQGASLQYGPSQLLEVCQQIVMGKVELSSWRNKLEEDGFTTVDEINVKPVPVDDDGTWKSSSCADTDDVVGLELSKDSTHDANRPHKIKFANGILTLGCIGFPNAGKSSVLNTLVGKKVVSVSQTPGHTKHLQTIFLTPTVKLCDCPGLVFPSLVPKSLQVIAGIFPVAQVREPYSVVGYLAKRVDLPRLLNLHPPDDASPRKRDKNSGDYIWSAFSICEAWALKNGFMTSKAGRPDIYRAANKILRMAVDGQICLYFKPPNYAHHLERAKTDPLIERLHNFLMFSSHRATMTEEATEEMEDESESETETEEDEDDNVAKNDLQATDLLGVTDDDNDDDEHVLLMESDAN